MGKVGPSTTANAAVVALPLQDGSKATPGPSGRCGTVRHRRMLREVF
ncbi:MAG: hypothetical protein AVDCRST_MAG55-20 [uncultured Rubrobacteraceae bacterium]|uniref:Uncharacterized protein n=1 Tax=uncultured Rubrobacteraceae bacterium TaxID=349277 RepID=A0A6J4NMW9_9ACTN|nr:MAG: hypothetical protein AVDCRST_MAG55-20 [uncultured Rubrobacteraceae bacterium]